ncbi:unnamed protein product [Penicillium roqueforti FM164]|uniref:Genomic scaffold, ProqFM164S04 n=1 Tax=Penicillium roqueforti (strain FM164) TaxID=1365484 RepID=W6QMH3_PENRF|nr:unnamed protein product [Penicillium roqueforti FM164]
MLMGVSNFDQTGSMFPQCGNTWKLSSSHESSGARWESDIRGTWPFPRETERETRRVEM